MSHARFGSANRCLSRCYRDVVGRPLCHVTAMSISHVTTKMLSSTKPYQFVIVEALLVFLASEWI